MLFLACFFFVADNDWIGFAKPSKVQKKSVWRDCQAFQPINHQSKNKWESGKVEKGTFFAT
jgi:hypothetical protein